MPKYTNVMGSIGISVGMGNEQSIEAIHVKYNREAKRMCSAKNKNEKIRLAMLAISTKHNPTIKSEHRHPKKRLKADN